MKVLFFASVREKLGCDVLDVACAEDASTTERLRQQLIVRGGEAWREVLAQPNLICAVNQSVVHGDQDLAEDDEVAFFPPVTGG